MAQALPIHTSELVLNWHVTEACNYRCRYCYAKWQDMGLGRELIHDGVGTRALLEELHHFFSSGNLANPLRQGMTWDSLRLNLAGGEPLLYGDRVVETLKLAREIGFETSMISNGSRLDADLMGELAPHLSMLGLSLDSANERTNRGIGRVSRHGSVLALSALSGSIALGRSLNPGLGLKINTVVNALNWCEDMRELIFSFGPRKWKVLRMLPMVTDDLAVSQHQFRAFIRRHKALSQLMRVEDNTEMAESYLMIDPNGRFFQNALGRKGYDYSVSILEAGAERAFGEVRLSSTKFCARYDRRPGRRAA